MGNIQAMQEIQLSQKNMTISNSTYTLIRIKN